MYCKNGGREFRDYKVYINDVRYMAVKEEDAREFEEELNDIMETLVHDGYRVVGVNYSSDEIYFKAVVEYVAEDDVYYIEEGEKENGQ